jgi:hypothetical protein
MDNITQQVADMDMSETVVLTNDGTDTFKARNTSLSDCKANLSDNQLESIMEQKWPTLKELKNAPKDKRYVIVIQN